LLFIAALACACVVPAPEFPSPPENFPDVVKRVAQARGLQPTREIKLASAPKPAPPADNAAEESRQNALAAALERPYKILGLVPNTTDFVQAASEFRRLDRLISYDRVLSSATWASGAVRIGAPLAKLHVDKAREFAPVFAVMQALQEQHFRWGARVDGLATEDRRSAFRALAAGDAALTLLTMGINEKPAASLPAQLDIAAQVGSEIDKLAADLPEFLRRQLIFPYRHGGLFAYWAFRSHGWRGVNALYADPPLSTSEILHPEKYFAGREAPVRFFPAHLLRRLNESPVVEQSLGEDAMIGLLSRDRWRMLPAEIAAGWRGDQLFVFRDGNDPVVLWFSAWREEERAQAFLRGYRSVLEGRHGIRFTPASGEQAGPWSASTADRRGWLLQRSQSVVLLASAMPASRLLDLALDAWKELQMDPEAMELRFESARLSAQLPARSR
jgi:hypothetical protein